MSSQDAFLAAQKVIPGGVNSPVRAFRSVGGTPRFIARAEGPYIFDVDGKRYIDYVGSYGPAIVGHAHPAIVRAVQEAATRGFGFGAPTEAETALAEAIVARVPAVEMVRLCNSGTEATMSAIRLARGYTGRSDFLKFAGCYHGHSDGLLVAAGSGALTLGVPDSPGVPAAYAQHTLTAPYNDIPALEQAFANYGDRLAAVIVEPVAGNMSCVPPDPAFLHTLRRLCSAHGVVLIFDEVMTGFRVALGGAQSLHGITPDLTTMGKVIGGGMPLAAFGGRKDIMACISPLGGVYQAGTLSGNPVAVAAGLKTLEIIRREGFYENLTARTEQLVKGFQTAAAKAGVAFTADSVGGMFGLYFADHVPQNYADMARSNTDGFKHFFHGMLEHGVAFGPSAYEAGFVSAAHTPELIDETVAAAEAVFTGMAE